MEYNGLLIICQVFCLEWLLSNAEFPEDITKNFIR